MGPLAAVTRSACRSTKRTSARPSERRVPKSTSGSQTSSPPATCTRRGVRQDPGSDEGHLTGPTRPDRMEDVERLGTMEPQERAHRAGAPAARSDIVNCGPQKVPRPWTRLLTRHDHLNVVADVRASREAIGSPGSRGIHRLDPRHPGRRARFSRTGARGFQRVVRVPRLPEQRMDRPRQTYSIQARETPAQPHEVCWQRLQVIVKEQDVGPPRAPYARVPMRANFWTSVEARSGVLVRGRGIFHLDGASQAQNARPSH